MRYLKIVQVFISFSLLILIFRKISVQEVKSSIEVIFINSIYLFAAICAPAIGFFASSLRLQLILKGQGIYIPLKKLVAINLIGTFYNQVFPSTIGGDVVRSMMLSKATLSEVAYSGQAHNKVMAFTLIGADRVIGIVGVLITGTIAVLLNPMFAVLLRTPNYGQMILLAVACILSIAVAYRIVMALDRDSDNRLLKSIFEKVRFAISKLNAILRDKQKLTYAIGLSIVIQIAVVFEFFMLSLALGLNIEAVDMAVIIPIVELVSMVPISINGIGLRENAMLFIGSPIGLTASVSILLSYFYLGIKILWGVLGGLVHIKEQLFLKIRE